ncbi:hypothetical protein ABIC59_004588 [Priestia aryabhattai]
MEKYEIECAVQILVMDIKSESLIGRALFSNIYKST